MPDFACLSLFSYFLTLHVMPQPFALMPMRALRFRRFSFILPLMLMAFTMPPFAICRLSLFSRLPGFTTLAAALRGVPPCLRYADASHFLQRRFMLPPLRDKLSRFSPADCRRFDAAAVDDAADVLMGAAAIFAYYADFERLLFAICHALLPRFAMLGDRPRAP